MTVCIAARFRWNYASAGDPLDLGIAAILVSDRMITAGDVEYEPQQLKLGYLAEKTNVLIAGDYSLHSEAIKRTRDHADKRKNATPFDIAIVYGQAIQSIQRRYSEDRYLAPLGLNTDSFIAQQKELSDNFVSAMTLQMQDHQVTDLEALIIGIENDVAHIYAIDFRGTVRSCDDVGFGAIGIGGWHARSSLMQAGYVNNWNFSPALTATFAAKKAAEIAPGIGKYTDVHLLLKTGFIELWPNVAKKIEDLYDEGRTSRLDITLQAVTKLQEFLHDPAQQAAPSPDSTTQGSNQSSEAKPNADSGGNNKAKR